MKSINYDNQLISYYGRWHDNGNCVYSGWSGSWIRFKFTGTSLKIKAEFTNLESCISVIIDENYPFNEIESGHRFSPQSTGINTVSVATGLSNEEHSAIVRLYPHPSGLTGGNFVKFLGIEIDDSGTVTDWKQEGIKKIAVMGDSYASRSNQFQFFLGNEYEIHPFGYPGQRVTGLPTSARYTYPYIVHDTILHNDPIFDAVVVEYGTNDAYGSVTPADFKTGMTHLVQQIRNDQPTARIFLLQMLKNNTYDFSIYGTVLQEIASEQSNVVYVPSSSIWNSVTWESDMIHPDTDGMMLLAELVENALAYNYSTSRAIKLKTALGIEEIPMFDTDPSPKNSLRIYVNKQIKYLKLVDIKDQKATRVRIQTPKGILALSH